MIYFLHFIAFLLLLRPLQSFDCISVTDDASCKALTGCSWTSNACSGSFIPLCSSNPCYYIDPISGSDIQEGSAQQPFQTLTKGLNALSGQAGSLFIINYGSEPEVQILDHTIISSFISIKY